MNCKKKVAVKVFSFLAFLISIVCFIGCQQADLGYTPGVPAPPDGLVVYAGLSAPALVGNNGNVDFDTIPAGIRTDIVQCTITNMGKESIPFTGFSAITFETDGQPKEFQLSQITPDPAAGQGFLPGSPFKFGLRFLSATCDKSLKQATVTILYGEKNALAYTFHVKCTAKKSGVENMLNPGEFYWTVPEDADLPAFDAVITVVAGGGDGGSGQWLFSGGGGGAGQRILTSPVVLIKGFSCHISVGDRGGSSSIQYAVPIDQHSSKLITVSCSAGSSGSGANGASGYPSGGPGNISGAGGNGGDNDGGFGAGSSGTGGSAPANSGGGGGGGGVNCSGGKGGSGLVKIEWSAFEKP